MSTPDLPEEPFHADRVVALCSDLIRIDTSPSGDGERAAAEFVAAELSAMGLEPRIFEQLPRRSSVLARVTGTDPARPALLVQAHLDVVAADAAMWSVPPFSGEVRDGQLWGRGAVDMKNMVAMVLTALRARLASGWRPARDIVIALLADEEMGGRLGAGWLVDAHPELFEGCREAVGEAGGFSHELSDGRRAYLVQVAEKGITWLRLTAHGHGGHGSLIHPDNPIARLAEALLRVQRYTAPHHPIESTETVVLAAQNWTGERSPDAALDAVGSLGRLLRPTLRNTYSITKIAAGVQHNVVPFRAEASIDGRYVPGYEPELLADIRDLVGDLVDVEVVQQGRAVATRFDGAVPDAIRAAIEKEDPGAAVVPTCLPIGTDGKHFSRLGIRNFGFVPLPLPPGYDFAAMFHGVDERVPVSSLAAGVRILERFFDEC
jgi:acetylornithine deacetylase/succinyl-diaminopimelate desuccinylase-like protein